jgi:hypothetical protein
MSQPHTLYAVAIAPMQRSLRNLDAIVVKAGAYVAADEHLDERTLVQARLYPNMRPFVYQVQIATDVAKGAAARLAGQAPPSWPDEEQSFADVHARIAKALAFLGNFKPEQFAGAEGRAVEVKLPSRTLNFASGSDYLGNFVLPNFYFHVTTAYNILRHNGLAIGKADFMGA